MTPILLFVLHILAFVHGDIYFHSPRGSNNRLNGRGRDRRNANRLFDSQNNARGGYNAGNDGSMYYYAGSHIPIEWTNQHSCNDPNNNCEIVIQYMCSPKLRDGTSEGTIPERFDSCRNRNCDTDRRFGMHEDHMHYMKCKTRPRNTNLFTADQNLRGNSAKYTRQNANGQRRGLECPEERDYYPYWAPSPWKDIVVFTNNISRCSYYKTESQNVKERYECSIPMKHLMEVAKRNKDLPNDKEGCEKLTSIGAKWTKVPAHNIQPPECLKSPWSRDNHNGNGIGGYPNMYNWTAPDINEENCTLRIRYNISTADFDPWETNSLKNGKNPTKVDLHEKVSIKCLAAKERGYVYKGDPVVQPLADDIGKKMRMRLAINTAQFGRTFQDRSHRFSILKRPDYLKGKNIYNVNVRGKRGNIVQVYPAVEYDFVPNTLTVNKEDHIHFQWNGADTNPGNNDGEGRTGTDRSNVVLLAESVYSEGTPGKANPFGKYGHWGRSYPEKITKTNFMQQSIGDLRLLAFVAPGVRNGNRNCRVNGNAAQLDGAPGYYDHGPRQATSSGTYHYFSTRNNNFSNRSQKGKIIVTNKSAAKTPNTSDALDKLDQRKTVRSPKLDTLEEALDKLPDDIDPAANEEEKKIKEPASDMAPDSSDVHPEGSLNAVETEVTFNEEPVEALPGFKEDTAETDTTLKKEDASKMSLDEALAKRLEDREGF